MNLEQFISQPAHLLTPEALAANYTEKQLLQFSQEIIQRRKIQRQYNQLLFYQPASEEAKRAHLSTAKHELAVGGNRSAKSTWMLVDALICMTKIVPLSLKEIYPQEKLRCPMRVRLMVNSLINTWEPIIKPKLQWDKWNGRGQEGGQYGHWGFIPPALLIKGKWDESWSEKNRTLTLRCGCTMQVMSYTQEVEDLRGISLHLVLNDEGSPKSHYEENRMRTMDVGGRMMMAMTPPDDESASWDAAWVFDELFEKGQPGPNKDPDIDSFVFLTRDNRVLDQKEIDREERMMSPKTRSVRLRGEFIHLSGRIYNTYTNRPVWWCFECGDTTAVHSGKCVVCEGADISEYCHFIEPFDQAYEWPCIFYIDPHPRKDHMMSWISTSPSDEYYQVAELSADAEPVELKKAVDEVEKRLNLQIVKRMMDPNMGESQAHNMGRRHVTVRDELAGVGLRCDLADDDFVVGKNRLNALLKPDSRTKRPRFFVFNSCQKTDYQFKHFTWDEYARYSSATHDPKQLPRKKDDDFPGLARYHANLEPTFAGLKYGGQVIRATGTRRGGY